MAGITVRMNRSAMQQPLSPLNTLARTSLWLLVFVIPLENVVIPGVGLLSIVVGIIASGICMLAIVERGSLRPLNAAHSLMGVFVLWAAISYLWSLDRDATLVQAAVYLRLLFLVWLIWQLASEQGEPTRLLQAFVLGTFAAGLDTIYQFVRQNEAAYQRYAGAGANPDDLGLMVALSVPIAYCCFIRNRGRIRWLYAAHMALAGTTIVLSATRGGALAVGVGLLIVPATAASLKRRQTVAILATLVLLVAAGLFLAPASSRERLATIPEELSGGSLSGRTPIWAAGVELFQEHPFIGVGAGAYQNSVRQILIVGEVAHNTFLSIVVELGIVGLAIFCALLGALLIRALELPWLPKRLWLVCAAVWFVGVSNLTWEMRKPTWLLFGLLLAHHASVSTHVARPAFLRECSLTTKYGPSQIGASA
jgi:O-antigen ligase